MSSKVTIKMVIPAKELKPRLGHQSSGRGCGVHRDKRTARNRTRADQSRKHIGEYQ